MRNARWPLALGLAGIMIAMAPQVAADIRDDVKVGVDLWNRGEYRKAVDQWRPLAIAGDPLAQFNLGQAYKLGRGVPVDLVLAESWYQKAAAQGMPEAENNYGLALFENGRRAEALPWLEKSVARGEPRAQLVLGTMLYNGDGVERDWPRAYALLVRANASGLPQAASVLAQMDQYIPTDDRQKGLLLARRYETDEQRSQLPPEIAGQGNELAMRGADLPPSTYDPNNRGPAIFTAPQRQAPRRAITVAPPPPPVQQRPERQIEVAQAAPPRAVPQGRGWRVQFGAFRDDGNAKALWEKLKRQIPGLANAQPYLVRSGTLTKLQAGPFASSAEVARVCVQVRPTGNPCVPIAP